jgi:hypothetical protein
VQLLAEGGHEMSVTCRVRDCDKPATASRGMCWSHYGRWYRHGHPMAPTPERPDPDDVMMSRVVQSEPGCWLYDSASARPPRLQREGRWVLVRVLVWRRLLGPVPEGMTLVSTCPHVNCVRPDHMQLAECKAAC